MSTRVLALGLSLLFAGAACALGCHADAVGDVPDGATNADAAGDGAVTDSGAPKDAADDSSTPDTRDASDAADAADASDAADATDATDAKGTKCPTGHGPVMALVHAGDVDFCIDETEVTVGNMDEFVAAGLPTTGGPSVCTYVADRPIADGSAARKNLPAFNYVTWCWADAYCRWAGKRLCRGLHGGPNTASDSEWEYACTNGGKTVFPYGNSYDPGACQTLEPDVSDGGFGYVGPVVDVGSRKGCHGLSAPFDSIFDMSGNVVEYVDDGPTIKDATTYLLGGWSGGGSGAAPCANTWDTTIEYTPQNTGFRCCATPTP